MKSSNAFNKKISYQQIIIIIESTTSLCYKDLLI